MGRDVVRHHAARSHDAVPSYVYPRGQHAVGTYPYVVLDDHFCRGDLLFVKTLSRVAESMVQPRHHDTLGQIHMISDVYRADNGIVESNTAMVSDADGTYGIIHTRMTLSTTLFFPREKVWKGITSMRALR